MKNSFCDNTDCENSNKKQPLFLTVLHIDFDYDICWWCSDCIERDKDMIYMSELEINELHRKLMKR